MPPTIAIIAPDALGALPAQLNTLREGGRFLVVHDEATWAAAGDALRQQVGARAQLMPLRLSATVKPLATHAEAIAQAANGCDGVIALGSGTLSDLGKAGATIARLPLITVATAASMNGYTSVSASLLEDGHKTSRPVAPPVCVIADLRVIAAAPSRLAAAGMADTLCRSTVEADARLSHLLCDTPAMMTEFTQLRAHEAPLLRAAPAIAQRDLPAHGLLMQALIAGGDAMAATGSSAVASQGEHMLAHTLELLYPLAMARWLHGEVIALTTHILARLQTRMLSAPPPPMPTLAAWEESLARAPLPPQIAGEFRAILIAKQARYARNYARLVASWDRLAAEIGALSLPAPQRESAFALLKLPSSAQDLGLTPAQLETALALAPLTRERLTFLDLAAGLPMTKITGH